MQLEGDLHVVVTGEGVDLLPERHRDAPLVVQHLQRGGVPGVDDPVDPGCAGLAAGQTRHGDDAVLAEPVGQPDRAADVLGVFVTDRAVGVQRVPVAVQAGDGHPGALEHAEVVIPSRVAGQDLIEGGDVHRRQEPTGVDLDAGQAEVGDDLQGLGQGTVVQDRVVDAELHTCTPIWWVATVAPLLAADSATAASSSMLRYPFVEGGAAGQAVGLWNTGDLFEERAGLVGERFVLSETDAGGIHCQTARRCMGVPGRG